MPRLRHAQLTGPEALCLTELYYDASQQLKPSDDEGLSFTRTVPLLEEKGVEHTTIRIGDTNIGALSKTKLEITFGQASIDTVEPQPIVYFAREDRKQLQVDVLGSRLFSKKAVGGLALGACIECGSWGAYITDATHPQKCIPTDEGLVNPKILTDFIEVAHLNIYNPSRGDPRLIRPIKQPVSIADLRPAGQIMTIA